jgi:hypothetical protein
MAKNGTNKNRSQDSFKEEDDGPKVCLTEQEMALFSSISPQVINECESATIANIN